MTRTEEAMVTADAIVGILRTRPWNGTAQFAFEHIWSETAAGYETYGRKDTLWCSFVRENADSRYWYKRVLGAVLRRLDGVR